MGLQDRSFIRSSGMLILCGLLSGLVVAAAAFPAVAMSGLAAKAGGQAVAELPASLKSATAPQVSRMVAADNKTEIAVFYDEFRQEVPLKDIAKTMQDAIVAAEDHKFFLHDGVDRKGLVRAFVNNKNGGSQQGASTLTMQYVRMSLSYSANNPQEVLDATVDTPTRKIAEMKYALQIEKELTKQQILERYLNTAPFGNGSYGIAAASQVYFQKKPKNLTIAEAALLAGMVKAPTGFDPTTTVGYPKALDRRNWVIANMRDLGYINAKDAITATKAKLAKTVKRSGNGCSSVKVNDYGFFCDYFYRWWLGRSEFGKTEYDRERQLKSGGYRIQATLDSAAQKAARNQIKAKLGTKEADALLVAAVQPGTGRVRALAANRVYKIDDPSHPKNELSPDPKKREKKLRGSFPNTTNPLISGGGDVHGYQAGSVFKMFTMVAALEKGLSLSHTINTEQRYKSKLYVDGSNPDCGGKWCPANAGKSEQGPYTMWSGFGASVNTYFVPLEESVGAEKVVDVAERFGVKFREPGDQERADKDAHMWGAFTLGVSMSTPLDMANAYATLAGDGKYCEDTPVQAIVGLDGKKLPVGNPHCKKATSPDVARAAIDAARCPLGDRAQLGSCGGRGTSPDTRGIVDHPVYGKTGTTDNDKTASLIAGTTSMVVAGYLVNPDWPNHGYKMQHSIVNPVVQKTLRDIMKGKPSVQFKKPGQKIAKGEQKDIPGVSCLSVSAAGNKLKSAGFEPSTGGEVESDCPKGTAAGTEPSGSAPKGSGISIEISSGAKKETKPEQPANPGPGPGRQDPPITIPGFPTRPGR
jgi:membrane peptidoglycan carboxypeptidase